MATVAATPSSATPASASAVHEKFAKGPGMIGTLIFGLVAIAGLIYIGWSLSHD